MTTTMGSFEAKINELAVGHVELVLRGVIDERATTQLEKVFEHLRDKHLQINFKDVERTTSFGIGVLMRSLHRRSSTYRVEFRELSERMVDLFRMLDFAPYGRIMSFYSRYHCARCGREDVLLLHIHALTKKGSEIVAPSHRCKCGGTLVIEDSLDFLLDEVSQPAKKR
jgi:anti-anti-sigma regulatory factor